MPVLGEPGIAALGVHESIGLRAPRFNRKPIGLRQQRLRPWAAACRRMTLCFAGIVYGPVVGELSGGSGRERDSQELSIEMGRSVRNRARVPQGDAAQVLDKLTLHVQTNTCMNTSSKPPPPPVSGDELLGVLQALANPHRLRVLGVLVEGRNYVSQIARELQISRPLLQIHLRKLEQAGLVSSVLELSEDGKSMKFYDVSPFSWKLTPNLIATAAATLTVADREGENGNG
jgi:DNA-binding transcriptional ArsR family regulator